MTEPANGENDSPKSTDDHVRLRDSCLDHAADLIASAELLLIDNRFPNVAYHLSLLALEEVGKGAMISSRAVTKGARDTYWIEKRLGDHIGKIQHAIWSASLASGRIDPKDFEEARRFAQRLHGRRLQGLYVNPDADSTEMAPPRAAVRVDQATSVLDMARACLDVEKARSAPDVNAPNEDLKWFLSTIDEEIGAKPIFSKEFIDKYQELHGDAQAWITWARQEFERIAADETAHLQRELARLPSAPENARPKWVIKARLFTPSHSIRPKALSFWNQHVGWAKLIYVGKKNELMLEMTLGDSFSAQNAHDAGLSASKLCIAALNMGSLGFFWYELPRQGKRFYESIKDLDAPKMDVTLNSPSAVTSIWNQAALSEKNLRHAIECMAVFGPMSDREAEPIFGPYLQGLIFVSKSDQHLSCETQARDAFLQCLRSACRHFADWDGREQSFVQSLHVAFEKALPEKSHRDQLFSALSSQNVNNLLANAMAAKRLADLYLVIVADRLVSDRLAQETVNL